MSPRQKTNRALLVALWVALVAVYAVGVRFGMQHIQRDLTGKSAAALAAVGLNDVSVHFTGREATLTGVAPNAAAVARARRAVEAVEGVRWAKSAVAVVRAPRVAPKPRPEPAAKRAPVAPPDAGLAPPRLVVRRVGDRIFVQGEIPTEDLARARAALAKLPSDQVVDQLRGGPVEARPWTRQLWPLLPALAAAPGVGLTVNGGRLMLSGQVDERARRDGLASAAAAVAFDLEIDNRIVVRAHAVGD